MSEYRLGDLQLRIMRVLWEQGGATVSDVHEALRRQARRPDGSRLAGSPDGSALAGSPDGSRVASSPDGSALAGSPADRQLAYTTIATMLRKMEDRGLVTHDPQGRRFVYRAAVGADEVTRSMAGDLLDRLFEGSLADMVHHMLTEREVSQEELSRLEQLIAERKTQRRGGRHAR